MSKLNEELLAAPEGTLKNETERRKYAERKAQEEAKKQQLLASKATGTPTIEDLCADMIRVAECEKTNPYHKFRILSRKRYELYGHYPILHVDTQFGTFAHAKQVAGLEDQAGTRLKKLARAEASRLEHVARYLDRYVRPYAKRPKSLVTASERGKLVISISDTHATFLDPFTWECFLAACRDLKPDVVYFNGDIIDGAEISRFPKVPGWTIPLQMEFDFAREMFRQTRKLLPHAEIVWGGGNHGVDRIAHYLTQAAPALACLRSMRFDHLAGVADLGIILAMGGTIASPLDQEDDRPGMLLFSSYRIHHGTFLGECPALRELRAAGRSGQSGHVHRSSVVYGTTERDAGMSWMTTPMGCTELAGRSYMKGITTGWQRGFGVCWIYPDGDCHQYPVVTDHDRATVEGHVYRRGRIGNMDPRTLWIVK